MVAPLTETRRPGKQVWVRNRVMESLEVGEIKSSGLVMLRSFEVTR